MDKAGILMFAVLLLILTGIWVVTKMHNGR